MLFAADLPVWVPFAAAAGGALLGAIVGAVAKWLFDIQLRKKPKHVIWQVDRIASLLSISKSVRQRSKVTFDGEPIEKLSLLRLRLWNPGDDDITTPIQIKLK